MDSSQARMRLKADELCVGRLVTPAGHQGHRNVAQWDGRVWEAQGDGVSPTV